MILTENQKSMLSLKSSRLSRNSVKTLNKIQLKQTIN